MKSDRLGRGKEFYTIYCMWLTEWGRGGCMGVPSGDTVEVGSGEGGRERRADDEAGVGILFGGGLGWRR